MTFVDWAGKGRVPLRRNRSQRFVARIRLPSPDVSREAAAKLAAALSE